MIFSSFEYVAFFLTVLGVLRLLRGPAVKKFFLLGASYFFYAWWDYRFVALMLVLSLANYFLGKQIETATGPRRKRFFLVVAVILDLTVLGFFKYYNFFISNIEPFSARAGIHFPFLNIILPVGISFITFEVMSYTIDIYRGNTRSAGSFIDLALLVAFFPHLIAGPILKPMHFLPQLNREITIEWKNIHDGSQIFIFGLFKKLLIADRLSLFVDEVFRWPGDFSATTLWIAVVAYAIQIYCDFSGYSDMAIGSARCLGFEIPLNFNMPYLSTSITEFWRRWHISLSTWLKEYLYFSLGGNRKGKVRTYINLMIVMLLGGLWHGASWNFVLWGALHGIGLAVHKMYTNWRGPKDGKSASMVGTFLAWALTFLYVCIGWVFFRARSFEESFLILGKMFGFLNSSGISWIATSFLLILPVMILGHVLGKRWHSYPRLDLSKFAALFVIVFTLLGLLFLSPLNSSPFIYFQF
jgi:alginate O-acetyltransferase complex protein AlgI